MPKSASDKNRDLRARQALAMAAKPKAVVLTEATEPLAVEAPSMLPATWEEVYEVLAASSPGVLEGQDKMAVVVGAKVILRALAEDAPASIVAEARGFMRDFGLTPAARGSIARDFADAKAKARSWMDVP